MVISMQFPTTVLATIFGSCFLCGCPPRNGPLGNAGDQLMRKTVRGSLGFAVEQSVRIRAQDCLVNRGRWPVDVGSFFSLGPMGLRYYAEGRTVRDGMVASEVRAFRSEPITDGVRYRLTWRGRNYAIDVYKPDAETRQVMAAREIERRYGGPGSDFGKACREAAGLDTFLTLYAEDAAAGCLPAFDSKTDRHVLEDWPGVGGASHAELLRSAAERPWRYFVPRDVVGHEFWQVPDWQITLAVQGDVPVEGVAPGGVVIDLPGRAGPGKPAGKAKVMLPDWFSYDGLG